MVVRKVKRLLPVFSEVIKINIQKFSVADIARAVFLTKLTWGEELPLINEKLKNVLYEAMVRYYFRSEEFSFKLEDNVGIQGFLLAAPLHERDKSQAWLKDVLAPFSDKEQDLVYNYLRYLSYNGQKVRALAQTDDLLLCLFLSRKAGVGSKLLQNIEAVARLKGINKLFLWADATCDYEYYQKRGYSTCLQFRNDIFADLGAQETWIYSKRVKKESKDK